MTESTDTPSEAPGELNVDTAAKAFENLLDPPEAEDPKVDTEVDPPKEAETNAQDEGGDAPITITVDGKQVTLTQDQLADAYKNGLRQSDYTQKTMALADQRKTAEAEAQKAIAERQTYANNLQKMSAQLEGAIEQQAKIDWDSLITNDPVEAMRQQHLLQKRQAQLAQSQQELHRIAQLSQSEQAEALRGHLQSQQQELLAKLPEWKDEGKAKSEREAIKAYLTKEGYDAKAIEQISDHRAVVLSRKAMLYDQMVAKASAAAKKVQNLPTKVERPGVSSQPEAPDGRSAAMRRHSKEGSLESLADAFTSIL